MTLSPRQNSAPFVLSSDFTGGHRHNYHIPVPGRPRDASQLSNVQVKGRFDNVRKLFLRATQKLQSFQPEHRHFENEDDLYGALLDEAPSTSMVHEDGRIIIGQGAFGEVSVITLGSAALSQQQITVPFDKTKLWPLLPSPSSPPPLDRGDGELWRLGNIPGDRASLVAVKHFRRRPGQTTSRYRQKAQREFDLAKVLLHPNVIQTYNLIRADSNDTAGLGSKLDDDRDKEEGEIGNDEEGENNISFYQIMEYCSGGDVDRLIRSRAPAVMETAEADCLFLQLLDGVKYLHDTAGIAHCDIKPENLLLTRAGCLKIADFGCSQRCRSETDGTLVPVSAAGGSERYRAPEQHDGGELNGPAIDIWACGVTYMVMRLGRRLWPAAKADDEYYLMYLQGRREAAGYLPIEVLEPVECRNIVYCMLDPVARRRIKASQLLRTEWARSIQVCSVCDTKVQ